MAIENQVLRISGEAAEDLSNYQYHFVYLNSSSKIALMDLEIDRPLGILQNAPGSGEEASVMIMGISKLVANGALTVGKFVKPEFVSTSDCGKGQDCGADRGKARGVVLEAATAEDELCSVRLLDPRPGGVGVPIEYTNIATITTADVVTYTAAQLLGTLILRDPAGSGRSDVTPTAALIVAAIPNCAAGDSFYFTIKNTADAAETITLTAGSSVTLSGTMTIAQNYLRMFKAVVTTATSGAEAVTVYSLGTLAF